MSEKECAPESHAIGNLKARISKFYATNSESGKAIYLGVVDEHLLKNTQPVLFKAYLGAGLKEIAEETFKSDGLLRSLIKCTNFKRCNSFILCVWEAFYCNQLQQFFASEENESGVMSFDVDNMKQFVIDHINAVDEVDDIKL